MKSALALASFICAFTFLQPQKDPLTDTLKSSDDLYFRFDNKGAYEVLIDANKNFPHNADVLWRLSRVEVHIGDRMPASTDDQKNEQIKVYQAALSYADSAVAADPKNSMAYTYRAAANGKIALFKGVFSVAPVVKQVRDDCERAISLDPNNSIAYYILGRTHAKLAEKPSVFRWPLGLSWGNLDDAIRFYQKAVSLDPNFVMFRLDLAKAYVTDDEYQKARDELNAIPPIPKRDEGDDSLKVEAQKILQEINNK
ncbi:MAG TPA: tetratricopeptide repeat protein [Candidatus Acidoferrales bacterium]|nr:tetratricopeptide repeat protein [Candidatus Acidoferrales bacterium]